MEYSKDERTVPEWLNDAFFLDVIREYTRNDRAQLCHGCKLRPGTKPGEHFASVMYRTTIHYRTGGNRGREASLDVIMKIKPFQGGLKKEMLEDSDVFVKEMYVYSKVLPEMARRLGAIGETLNFPRLIYASVKPHTILILEDVTGKGWRTGQYITTFEEVIPSVKAIAKFHAASVVIERDDPTFSVENQCNIANQLRALDEMTKKSIDNLLEVMRGHPEFASLIKPVEKLKTTLLETLIESYSPSANCLNVVVHGDFHSKNLLHQFSADGRLLDTMLIDYQICSWTTPAVDVHYLLDTIVDQSLKETHRDKIVCLYYEEFCRLLVRLGYIGHIPGLIELQIELLRKGAQELFHYITLYPFRFIDRAKINFEELLSGKASNPAAHSETYRRVMKTVLLRFLQQGVMTS
ncbi:uncharacterized protein LOC126570784 [Anopheles aquasalis]|uniref:uncharacterized protein LOC126570784 n=1 Tax=Anopheles aquasalis TaxID=42839 RepID=UPI00215B35F3|nr:uncharacterized protein LOC126570784 [Anopheles aquasalis]